MRNATILGLILLMAIGGYFLFFNEKETVEEIDEISVKTVNGVVIEVNTEEIMLDGPAFITLATDDGVEEVIAVPSMGMLLCAAKDSIADFSNIAVGDTVSVIGNVDEEGRIVPCEESRHGLVVDTIARDVVYGYEFTYRKGPDGYITIEDNESADENFVTGLHLFNQKEYEEFLSRAFPSESPTAMGIRIYQNPENLDASVWATRKPRESNIELAVGGEEEVVVGGANAIRYKVDGLYLIDTYVVASGSHIYVLTGSYQDNNSQIYTDFQSVVASFTFIPTPEQMGGAPEGKIDVKIACESALAYMTFPSGEEAEAFVVECINGDHPEVIDRYISDMGMDGAAI